VNTEQPVKKIISSCNTGTTVVGYNHSADQLLCPMILSTSAAKLDNATSAFELQKISMNYKSVRFAVNNDNCS